MTLIAAPYSAILGVLWRLCEPGEVSDLVRVLLAVPLRMPPCFRGRPRSTASLTAHDGDGGPAAFPSAWPAVLTRRLERHGL